MNFSAGFITVKKDKPVKLALDSKVPNMAVDKNRCRMPNLGFISQKHIPEGLTQKADNFYEFHLKYVYSQNNLDLKMSSQCKFTIITGRVTGR